MATFTPITPAVFTASTGLFYLRILATTDLHVHITPWDYYADHPSVTSGLSRTATLIAAARAEAGTCLLLDNGDFLNGSPMGDLVAERGLDPVIHPMIAAMNALDYDAATLGNHEFSSGLPFLLHHLAKASFPGGVGQYRLPPRHHPAGGSDHRAAHGDPDPHPDRQRRY